MQIMNRNKLKQLSKNFRAAILRCDLSELCSSFENFPAESCADASMLLGTYLIDNKIRAFNLIKGKRGEGHSLETHYWLERDNIIVDITADQFDDVNEDVVITGIDANWYNSFKKEIRQEANFRKIPFKDIRNMLSANYDYILQFEK